MAGWEDVPDGSGDTSGGGDMDGCTGRTLRRWTTVLIGGALLLAACGESNGVDVSQSDSNASGSLAAATTMAAATTTEAAATTTEAATSTLPPTTLPPTTTAAPTTTEAPTTTIAGIPSGWHTADFPDLAFPPCCASNWYGQPSPAAPADPNAPLPDGDYRLIVSQPWDPEHPDELVVEVHRFEQCTVLPAGSCEQQDSYEPDELGYEDAPIRTFTLPLDDTIEAGVVGWQNCTGLTAIGNGADLAALITDYQAAYQNEVWPRITGGEDPFAVIQDLAVNPANGFGPPDDPEGMCNTGYEIVFDAGTGAPPLLLQGLVSWSSDFDNDAYLELAPMEELLPTMLQVQGGVLRPFFYAGFYS